MSLWKAEQFRPTERENTPQPDTAIPEWLDRYPWLPILFLILLPFLVELPLLIFGLSTNPIWQQSGIVEGVRAGLLPGLSYGDPNVGWTTQALGHLAAEDWLHGIIPWWNPYSGIGLPLAGEMQPNAFFLPFVFFLLLHNGVLWLKIAMQVFAGLATFALLRELKLGRLAALTGGALYALNGTFAWMPGPVAVINTIPFLPLLLYGIERARKERNRDGIIWIALAISGSLYAGFPEAAYINGLLALAWAIYRFLFENIRWIFLARVIVGGAIGLLLAAPIINAFASYLVHTNAYHMHSQYANVFLDVRDIPIYFFPYIYGPIASTFGKSFLVYFWGEGTSYVGIMIVFFASLSLAIKNNDRVYLLLIIYIILSFIRILGLPGHSIINHIPLLTETMFTRYSSISWGLAVVILAMFTLERLNEKKNIARMALAVALLVLTVGISVETALSAIKHNKYLFISLLYASFMLAIFFVMYVFLPLKNRRYMVALLLIVDCSIMFIAPELSGMHPGKVDKPAIRFLHSNLGLQRFYTLGPIEPNYSAYFDIASINHNYLPIATNWATYVRRNIFPPLSKSSDVIFWAPWYGGNTGVESFIDRVNNYERLGVRYVVINKGQSLLPGISYQTGTGENTPLALENGGAVTVKINASKDGKNNASVTAVSVFQGNYGNTANGKLTVKACTSTNNCVMGSRPLSESQDNSPFSISLAKPLQVKAGAPLTITFTHLDSTRPEAFWLWPQAPGHEQTVIGPQGPIPGKAIQFSLETSDTALQGLRKVYSDALLDIWELPHPAPYYTVMHGDCQISNPTRDGLVAQCSTPATLQRRELYMPGWSASVNGVSTAVSAHQKIFQTIALSAGKNVVRFRFAPPYVNYAWIAFWLSIIALLWWSYRTVFQLRANTQKTGEKTA
ncbi:YfhO family protein [Acidithiobacillus ferrivorans]|nr:YfhO family protein [Acidithiobacillus ferrivorans]